MLLATMHTQTQAQRGCRQPRGGTAAALAVAGSVALLVAMMLTVPGRAHAAAQSFVARTDRAQVPMDDSFIFEVTLVLDEGRATTYRAPDFKNFRVLGEHPSQSTQIQMGNGTTFMQVVYSWRYELMPLKTGQFQIGSAKVKLAGREIQTTPVSITVTEAMGGQAQPQAAPQQALPPNLRDMLEPRRAAPSGAGGQNFVRVVPSKSKAYVGEQLTVEWYLYLTERQDKYETTKEPPTDGFWVEDLPIRGNERGLSLTQQTFEGRPYLVAPLLRKALFPLHAGTLTLAPMEADIAQVDFFGASMRSEHIKAEVVNIEVLPLPKNGQPPNFDRAAVGTFSMAAVVDKQNVAVGEPITFKLLISGQGNVRKLAPPTVPSFNGFKAYEPKVTSDVTPGEPVSGSKTVEVLLLAQKAGTVNIPPLSLAYFDPSKAAYAVAKTDPLTLVVRPEEGAAPTAPNAPAPSSTLAAAGSNLENILPTELRPIRGKSTLRRDLGSTLYRSPWFVWMLLLPPVGFGLLVTTSQVRQRLLQDTERRRGRRMRRQVRRRLGVAEGHLATGKKAAFFIEIDRSVRDLLSAKLGRVVTGLSMEELRRKLAQAGLDPALANRVTAMLEECDQARFAPGSVSDDGMTTALDRAGELIVQLERARLTTGEAN